MKCTKLFHTGTFCSLLHCTVLYCTVLYCTVWYCTVLYCMVLYCTVLYCTGWMTALHSTLAPPLHCPGFTLDPYCAVDSSRQAELRKMETWEYFLLQLWRQAELATLMEQLWLCLYTPSANPEKRHESCVSYFYLLENMSPTQFIFLQLWQQTGLKNYCGLSESISNNNPIQKESE